VAEAAKAGMTTLEFIQFKAQEATCMGVVRTVVRMAPGPAPEQAIRRTPSSNDSFSRPRVYGNWN
jgi:hypothetical protein